MNISKFHHIIGVLHIISIAIFLIQASDDEDDEIERTLERALKKLKDRRSQSTSRPTRRPPPCEEAAERFNLGAGRGRIPMAASQPIEITATKIGPFANGSEQERPTSSRDNLVLTDDTQKALTNFGSLLLKDTLEVPRKKSSPRRKSSRKFAGATPSRHQMDDEVTYFRDQQYHSNYRGNANLRNHRTTDGNEVSRSSQDQPEVHRDPASYQNGNNYQNDNNMNLNEYGTATERNSFYRTTPTPSLSIESPNGTNDSLAEYHRQRLNQDHPDSNVSIHNQRNKLPEQVLSGGADVSSIVDYPTPSSYPEDKSSYSYSSFGVRHQDNETSPVGIGRASFENHVELRRSNHTTNNSTFPGHSHSGDRDGHASSLSYGNFTSLSQLSGNGNVSGRREPLASAQSTGGYNGQYGPSYLNNYNYTGPNRKDPRLWSASSYDADMRNYSQSNYHQQHQPAYSSRDYEPGARYPPPPPPPPPVGGAENDHHHHYYHQPRIYPMNNYAETPRGQDHYTAYSRPNRPFGQPNSSSSSPSSSGHNYPPPSYPPPPLPPSMTHGEYPPFPRYSSGSEHHEHRHANPNDYYSTSGSTGYGSRHPSQQPYGNHPHDPYGGQEQGSHVSENPPGPMYPMGFPDRSDSKTVNEYLKRVHFSDSDRDKLMASYLTCDGLLNDNDHCLERLSCEFSDPMNIEKANKLDRAVSSILLGHILINTYIPNQFKLRLKSASLYGYTQSGKCARFACNKLANSTSNTNTDSER